MTVTVNTIWYGSSVDWTAMTAWAALTAKTAGQLVRQLAAPSVGNERAFVCIIAGTTLAAEPTWTVTKGAKTAEAAGPTWQECTGQPATNGDLTNTPLSSANRSGNVTLGLIIKNNAATFLFICSTAGTTGAGEPTYNTTTGGTTTDSGATWTCIGAAGAFASFAGPFARVSNFGVTSFGVTGDTLWLRSTHAETQGTAITYNFGTGQGASLESKIICITGTHIPPISGDITTGASITTTSGNITMSLLCYFYGITFVLSAGKPILGNGTTSTHMRYDSCTFNITSSSQTLIGNIGQRTDLINCTFGVNSSTARLCFQGEVYWRDSATPLTTSLAHYPSPLINVTSLESASHVLIENCNFSVYDGNNSATGPMFNVNDVGAQRIVIKNCLPPSTAIFLPIVAAGGGTGWCVDVINTGASGHTYINQRFTMEGTQDTDATVVRTGGASDGTTPVSWKVTTPGMTPPGYTSWTRPFELIPIDQWNTVINTDRIVTLEGWWNGAALPNNDDIWLEATYFGTSGSTLGSRTSQGKVTYLTTHTALPSSLTAWTAPARQNSHAYAVGDVILPSNTTLITICTSAGTSASSVPGGYASAVDGGAVTDGGATFQMATRFQLTVTLSSPQPKIVGDIRCQIKIGSNTGLFWIDPYPTFS